MEGFSGQFCQKENKCRRFSGNMFLNFAFYSGPVFCLHLKLVMRSFTTSPNDVFFRFLCDFGGAEAVCLPQLISGVLLFCRRDVFPL